jgi:hypothetical protein
MQGLKNRVRMSLQRLAMLLFNVAFQVKNNRPVLVLIIANFSVSDDRNLN